MRAIVGALLFALSAPCFAHQLWWTRPTHYADGREIGPADGLATLIEWSDGDTFTDVDGTRPVPTASSVTLPDPISTRCYRVRAVVGSEQSVPSDVWCKVIGSIPTRRIPNAPTGLGGN